MNPTRNRIVNYLPAAVRRHHLDGGLQLPTTALPLQEALPINQVAADIQTGDVDRIREDDNRLTVVYQDGTEAHIP